MLTNMNSAARCALACFSLGEVEANLRALPGREEEASPVLLWASVSTHMLVISKSFAATFATTFASALSTTFWVVLHFLLWSPFWLFLVNALWLRSLEMRS